MIVTIDERGTRLRERLRGRLASAERLRCAVHDKPVEAVVIHGFENGWFDAMWTTCCQSLANEAGAIVKRRC